MKREEERSEQLAQSRARTKELQQEFAERGDVLGWFDALYKESGGNNEKIPWADLEPNHYFKTWAESTGLRGDGRRALVVGCGLGDDARYLHDLGFSVTGFDISPTAIEWAEKLHAGTDIEFHVADLFAPPERGRGHAILRYVVLPGVTRCYATLPFSRSAKSNPPPPRG